MRQWFKKYSPKADPCGPDATVEQLQDEISRLRKQLRRAETEKQILKTAAAYFAKESQ
jgi:transposase